MVNKPGRAISEVFISRPQPQAGELAVEVEALGLEAIVQPAFRFARVDLATEQPEALEEVHSVSSPLLVFTSTRSVVHGLAQLSAETLQAAQVVAIGPATARALGAAGLRLALTPGDAYTSEALLTRLAGQRAGRCGRCAYIIAAPGGRQKLAEGLQQLGWKVRVLMVYRAQPLEIDPAVPQALRSATALLSVWTSANAIESLARRLPSTAWQRLCRGEWLVISERLREQARVYAAGKIHLAAGPGNTDILHSIRSVL
ncbi:MAG: uroporphyrinogen-III synthase [Xanthomonadales bacterium]|nr:uroporphyrinogen-III synthase [Xanthomonadales bacterium]